MDGRLAANPVALVLGNVLEAVRDRRRSLAGKRAREQRVKVTGVIHIHVLVRGWNI